MADAPGLAEGVPGLGTGAPRLRRILVENGTKGTERPARSARRSSYFAVRPVPGSRRAADRQRPQCGVLAVEVKMAGRTDVVVSTRRTRWNVHTVRITASGAFAFASTDNAGHGTQGYLPRWNPSDLRRPEGRPAGDASDRIPGCGPWRLLYHILVFRFPPSAFDKRAWLLAGHFFDIPRHVQITVVYPIVRSRLDELAAVGSFGILKGRWMDLGARHSITPCPEGTVFRLHVHPRRRGLGLPPGTHASAMHGRTHVHVAGRLRHPGVQQQRRRPSTACYHRRGDLETRPRCGCRVPTPWPLTFNSPSVRSRR